MELAVCNVYVIEPRQAGELYLCNASIRLRQAQHLGVSADELGDSRTAVAKERHIVDERQLDTAGQVLQRHAYGGHMGTHSCSEGGLPSA